MNCKYHNDGILLSKQNYAMDVWESISVDIAKIEKRAPLIIVNVSIMNYYILLKKKLSKLMKLKNKKVLMSILINQMRHLEQ